MTTVVQKGPRVTMAAVPVTATKMTVPVACP
jgi:hypothetical protein